jgi:hypothetical protein
MKKVTLKIQLSCFVKSIMWLFFMMTLSFSVFSQSVGISPAVTTIEPAAGLDVNFSTKGILVPRVALTVSTSFLPLGSTHVAGMIVYNTATVTDVLPGLYYNNGTRWIPVFPKVAGAGLLYWDGTAWVPVAAGVTGQKLQLVAGIPTWVP